MAVQNVSYVTSTILPPTSGSSVAPAPAKQEQQQNTQSAQNAQDNNQNTQSTNSAPPAPQQSSSSSNQNSPAPPTDPTANSSGGYTALANASASTIRGGSLNVVT